MQQKRQVFYMLFYSSQNKFYVLLSLLSLLLFSIVARYIVTTLARHIEINAQHMELTQQLPSIILTSREFYDKPLNNKLILLSPLESQPRSPKHQ